MDKWEPGIYETEYGNAAIVRTSNPKTAKDIDANMRIPIELVTRKFVRTLDDCEKD